MFTVGFAPCSQDLTAPGDRRRFCAYAAAREITFEIADPARRYDLVIVTAAADIVTWSSVNRPHGERIVYDMVDSYLAGGPSAKDMVRGLGKYALGDLARPVLSYRRAVERMCRRADAVVCGTAEQRSMIERHCANVHVILDVQDDDVREVKRDYGRGPTLNLFWEGLPYNLAEFATVAPALAQLSDERPVAVHLMTALSYGRWSGRIGRVQTRRLADKLFAPRAYLYEWNEQLLSRVASGCDLGVIPLDLTDAFARGKPENKLLSMWRMGLPTLTSATPAYRRAMAGAGLEMTCAGEAGWLAQLRRYADDEDARRAAGERGYAFAMSEHGAERICERWDRVLQSLGLSAETHSNSARRPSANATAG